jgi:aminodeoxyfutalosine synthase
VASCRLCAFGKRVRDPKAYTMSLDEVWHRAGEGWSEAVTEFHIVGGLHPELTFDWYCEMLRGLKQRFPQVHLKAFTMVEIAYLARRAKISSARPWSACAMPAWIRCPAAAPRFSASGSAASSATTRSTATNGSKPRARRTSWGCDQLHHALRPHRERRGPRRSPGEAARPAGRNARLRDLHPAGLPPRKHGVAAHRSKTTGFADIRNIAVARLMLDNIPHIKAYWVMMTPRIAQIALRFRRRRYRRHHRGRAHLSRCRRHHQQGLRRAELLQLIRKAGREPIERDTLYRPVQRSEATFTVLV